LAAGRRPRGVLLAEVEIADERAVTLDVAVLEVVEKTAALTDELQETTAAMVVLLVGLKVFREVGDALGEQSDLDLGGTGVGLATAVSGDNNGLGFWGK
jgi:hypothetical protein